MPSISSSAGPPICKANPGTGTSAQMTFSEEGRTWTEEVDLLALASSTLAEHGHTVEHGKGWLHHPESGFALVPRVASIEQLARGGVHTVTTIQVNHPTLAPGGV